MKRKLLILITIAVLLFGLFFFKFRPNNTGELKTVSFEEYLDTTSEKWFKTGKKKYTIQAMMVSKETSFHNDLEVTDYTVNDDGVTVILKGTVGEMWTDRKSVV